MKRFFDIELVYLLELLSQENSVKFKADYKAFSEFINIINDDMNEFLTYTSTEDNIVNLNLTDRENLKQFLSDYIKKFKENKLEQRICPEKNISYIKQKSSFDKYVRDNEDGYSKNAFCFDYKYKLMHYIISLYLDGKLEIEKIRIEVNNSATRENDVYALGHHRYSVYIMLNIDNYEVVDLKFDRYNDECFELYDEINKKIRNKDDKISCTYIAKLINKHEQRAISEIEPITKEEAQNWRKSIGYVVSAYNSVAKKNGLPTLDRKKRNEDSYKIKN